MVGRPPVLGKVLDVQDRSPERPTPALRFPSPMPQPSTRFANLALGLDATLCNVVGLIFTLGGAFMAEWLGIRGWILTVAGVVVLLWSFVVTLFANRRVARRAEVDRVITVNLVAIAAAVPLVIVSDSLTRAGRTLLVATAAVLAAFVVAQVLARRNLVS